MNRNHPFLKACEYAFSREPCSTIKGLISAYIAYPIAEQKEQRAVRGKLKELRSHYRRSSKARTEMARKKLVDIIVFAGQEVPYYKDLFRSINFDPLKIAGDIKYLEEIPILTKDIIREQGERMLSASLSEVRHHACKTGGSTGLSAVIYYDQVAADYSSAVTQFCRETAGNTKRRSELHFACRFPDIDYDKWPTKEDFKCFAMNRSNIFFDKLDDAGLQCMLDVLSRRKPYMVHAHPSTIYALACYVDRTIGALKAFHVFESSGELLETYQREKIEAAFKCRVVNRYGLAELGVMAYELDRDNTMRILESEGWPESMPTASGYELIFTGFRNRLMPLIRYQTGDVAEVIASPKGFHMENIVGRIHDVVSLGGADYATHTIQDILDHRVGGIQEFQIDSRGEIPIFRIVPELTADLDEISQRMNFYWGNSIKLSFVGHEDFVRVGRHAKFRHVVNT